MFKRSHIATTSFSLFQTSINITLDRLPVNTAIILLVDPEANLKDFRTKSCPQNVSEIYNDAMQFMEQVKPKQLANWLVQMCAWTYLSVLDLTIALNLSKESEADITTKK